MAAGLFTLVLSVALVAAAFWIRGKPIAHDSYVLHTKGNVSGLNAQAAVRYRGVDVGKVETIAFDPDDTRTILVAISVRAGTPITLGTYGQLAAQGITGLSYVQLSDDGSSAQLRNPADPVQARIELRPSFLERVSGSGEELVARITELTRRLDAWLGDANREQAVKTLTSLESAARGVSALSESMQPGVKAMPELVQEARTTIRSAEALLADLRSLAANLGERAKVLERVAVSAERIGTSVEQISARGSALMDVAGRETLPKLHETLEEMRRSSRSLERLVDELSASPSSLVFGKPQPLPGPGEPGFAHGVGR